MEDGLVSDYLEELRLKGRNPLTLSEYDRALRRYAAYLGECSIFSFFAAEGDHIAAYYRRLIDSSLCPSSVHKNAAGVYAFYQWLYDTGRILCNPAPKPPAFRTNMLPRRRADRISLTTVYGRLRESAHLFEQRDYIAMALGYGCGLRRCELQRLNVEDVCPEDGTIRVRGKRNKQRLVPIGKRCMADVLYYIAHVRPKLLSYGATRALLVSWVGGGKRMHPGSINRAFMRIRRKYSLDSGVTPHGLRHAFATDLVRSGAPVQDVSRILGHAKLETTQVYTRLMPLHLKNHHRKHHPRG